MEHCLKKHVVCKYHWSDYITPDQKHFLIRVFFLDLFLLVFQPDFLVLLAQYCQYILEEGQFVRVQQSLRIGYLYKMVAMVPVLVRLLLQIECQYILVFRPSQGLQQLPIAHLYILARKHGSLVRRWSQLEFPYTLVVKLLVRVQQSLQTGYLYKMVSMVPVLVRLLLQIGYQYILVFRPSQGLQQLLIAHLYILVCRLSLGLQSLPLEFLYTLVLVAPVQDLRLLQTARLYRLVCQSFLVPPKPLTGHPQPLDQLFPVRR